MAPGGVWGSPDQTSGKRPASTAWPWFLASGAVQDAGILPGVGDCPDSVGTIRSQGNIPDTVGNISAGCGIPVRPQCAGRADLPDTVGRIRNCADTVCAIQPTAWMTVFPLSWSHYVRLMSVEKPHARAFYEAEAIRGGWSVRQLDRQISTQFFERTSHSKRQAAMLARGRSRGRKMPSRCKTRSAIRTLLEFLNLKDEYSESELEEALVRHLEWFLLELGDGVHVRRPAETDSHRRRVVSHRPAAVSPPAAVPGGHRSEDSAKFTHADAGPDEPVPELRPGNT